MAATGFTPISLYYSSTASATPTAGNLVAGELAINTADGKLFYKDSAGVVQVIGTKGGVGSSTTTQVLYNSSGLIVGSANMTFDGTKLTLANDASISGLTVGKGGGSDANSTVVGSGALAGTNTSGYTGAFGVNALASVTSGISNNAFGWGSLQNTTTGGANSAFGHGSNRLNTTGDSNSSFGYNALYANTSGASNVSIGRDSLRNNTTASNNTAVGYQAMYSNTTGVNTAYGYQALYSNTTTSNNTAIGTQALYNNTANSNLAVGEGAMNLNTSGTRNTGIGVSNGVSTYAALRNNTTGSDNTAVGNSAMQANTTGGYNTAFGTYALASNTTAPNNTAVGYQAGYSCTAGGGNTFIGYQAGYTFSGGSGSTYNNTCLGNSAGYNLGSGVYSHTLVGTNAGKFITTGLENTVIGTYDGNNDGLDIRTSNGFVVLASGGGYVAARVQMPSGGWYQRNNSGLWSVTSDERIKENIVEVTNGLDVITALRPVEFDYKIGDKKHDVGFIAQEYQQILPNQIIQEESHSAEITELTNGEAVLGIQQNLVPYLVKAIQELKAEVDSLKQQLASK
jgi:trimeric autotransporter adhesin